MGLEEPIVEQVEAGRLEQDGLQERVVGYLSQALDKAGLVYLCFHLW